MESVKRNLRKNFRWILLTGLVFFLITPVVQADDGVDPNGYNQKHSAGDSVVFNMKDYSSIKVYLKIDTRKPATVEWSGTTEQSNSTFQLIDTYYIARSSVTISTGNYWQSSRPCDGGGCPKIKFTIKSNPVNVQVLSVTRK